MVFETFAQFFEVVRIAEKKPSVLVDCFESFLRSWLGQETLIFPESAFWLGLLCQGKMAFGACQPILYGPWNRSIR
jgi:hypothetical protein